MAEFPPSFLFVLLPRCPAPFSPLANFPLHRLSALFRPRSPVFPPPTYTFGPFSSRSRPAPPLTSTNFVGIYLGRVVWTILSFCPFSLAGQGQSLALFLSSFHGPAGTNKIAGRTSSVLGSSPISCLKEISPSPLIEMASRFFVSSL